MEVQMITKFKTFLEKHALSIIIVCLLLVVLWSNKNKPGPEVVKHVKTIEKAIAAKETVVNNFTLKANHSKALADSMHRNFEYLKTQLEILKSKKDTFKIIQIQDTIIRVLVAENTHLRNSNNFKDSVIVAQRFIINSQDTIIQVNNLLLNSTNKQLRKVKNQRNLSLVFNSLQLATNVFLLAK